MIILYICVYVFLNDHLIKQMKTIKRYYTRIPYFMFLKSKKLFDVFYFFMAKIYVLVFFFFFVQKI